MFEITLILLIIWKLFVAYWFIWTPIAAISIGLMFSKKWRFVGDCILAVEVVVFIVKLIFIIQGE